MGVHTLMAIVPFIAAWQAPASPGSWGYVKLVTGRRWSYLFEPFRLVNARTSAHATAFVGVPLKIALRPGAVLLARSRRSTMKLSWRRKASIEGSSRSENAYNNHRRLR